MTTQPLINVNGNDVPTLEILLMLTVLSLLPSLVIMVTSFTRTIVILSFVRNAIGVQQSPPNMVLVSIALFLTLFIMNPVITRMNEEAYTPYTNGEISQEEAFQRMQVPIKEFMLKQTEVSSLDLFMEMSGGEPVQDLVELPLTVVIPSFMTSELKRAFTAGFLILLPFLLVDVIVSTTLMSMGMVMLPPATISLPFKLLLFITVNGWELLFATIVQGFQ